MKTLIVSLLLLMLATPSPTISKRVDGEEFKVNTGKGAVWSCTRYQQQTITEKDHNFPDGHYTPAHCWGLDPDQDEYVDDWAYILKYDTDWKVWAEVQYGDGSEARTNVIEIHR